jgi:hypothetical protein
VGGTKAVGKMVGVRLGRVVADALIVAVEVASIVAEIVAVGFVVLVGVCAAPGDVGANARAIAPMQ